MLEDAKCFSKRNPWFKELTDELIVAGHTCMPSSTPQGIVSALELVTKAQRPGVALFEQRRGGGEQTVGPGGRVMSLFACVACSRSLWLSDNDNDRRHSIVQGALNVPWLVANAVGHDAAVDRQKGRKGYDLMFISLNFVQDYRYKSHAR